MAHVIKRRGLSDVVTTVLIILLVLAAVSILWGYLGNTLNKSGAQISGSTACLNLDLKPISCNTSAVGATVRFGRNSGEGQLVNVTLIFDVNGQTVTRQATYPSNVPDVLETKTQSEAGFVARPTTFTVAGTILTDAGQSKVCDKVAAVTCTVSS